MIDFRFTNEHQASGISDILDVLQKPRLWVPRQDYPDYSQWLEKVEVELQAEEKRAMLACSGRDPVGVVVYQRHKYDPQSVELKNISVAPDVRGRYVGSFLLRNTEVEAQGFDYPDCTRVTVDTKVKNSGMIGFLIHHGYTPIGVEDMYGLGAGKDIVFTKNSLPNYEQKDR